MAQMYRKIDPRIWTDEKFVGLTVLEKLIALNAITAQSNRCGIFRFSAALAAEQVGASTDSYAIAIRNVCKTLGWKYDERLRVLYLPTWWKYNPPENPKHLQGCLEDLHELPKSTLLKEFVEDERFIPPHSKETFNTYTHSYAIAMGVGMANQKQKQEQKQKQKREQKVSAADAADRTDPHGRVVAHFCAAWQAKYGEAYDFAGGKDGAHVKWMLNRVGGSVPRLTDVIDAYLADDRPFYAEDRHSIGILKSCFRRFITAPATAAPGKDWFGRGPTDDERALINGEDDE